MESDQEDVLSQLSADDLIKIIQELSPAYRMVFNLYAIEGYSHKEIADSLDITVNTSKSQLSRARKMLQNMLLASEQGENIKMMRNE